MDFHPVEANLRQSFRALASGRRDADVFEAPGVTIASLGVAFQMFNAAFLNAPVTSKAGLEKCLAFAHNHFRDKGAGWAFWFCEDLIDKRLRRRLTPICAAFGLRLASELPGMIAREVASQKRPLPALEFRRVDSISPLSDFRSVGSVCFRVPPDWFAEVFNEQIPVTCPEFVCWVAYYDGLPVATAASVASDGVVGLYNIATAPGFRGRGFAEAITRHAIAEALARTGPRPVILQSTVPGHRMYERMGFREVTRIVVFNSVY